MCSVVLPFIVSTDTRNVDAGTRKLIRSHVMRGKNKGKTPMKTIKSTDCTHIQLRADYPVVSCAITELGMIEASIPRPIGSEIASIRFADTAEPALIADVLSCK